AAGSPRLRQGVSPVRAPFDLGAVIDTLVEAHRQHRTRLLTTAADSAALWQELNAVDIGRRAEFLGAIDGAAHSLHRLEPVSYELLALLRERPETFRDLSRLSPGRRDLVEGLLQALERHGLVDWRGADGHRPG
ncbi:MAG TPA: hypothetical protein VD902_06540, partial [Symbiobacteriaceae bacterium]|nr:hypothetical protein [Symbiobacteriaceae bacterium]